MLFVRDVFPLRSKASVVSMLCASHLCTRRHFLSFLFALRAVARFMVFNKENYPNMVGLFGELGVASELTDMSFRYPALLLCCAV